MDLKNQQCVPCHKGEPSLSLEQIQHYLKSVPEWMCDEDKMILSRYFTFKNFKEALAFVNNVGDIAEEAKHHPDISFGWGYVRIELQTHAISGLHLNDFIVAQRINGLSI
ncbi:MAG: 4a-hydroxytetrahydrobiopterin dehydratase [Alphaproteobacteria bacterium]|nr:4a-hydroxytetrahydrobiopterin dehydratase [Alphaproteobacteria bacterium]